MQGIERQPWMSQRAYDRYCAVCIVGAIGEAALTAGERETWLLTCRIIHHITDNSELL